MRKLRNKRLMVLTVALTMLLTVALAGCTSGNNTASPAPTSTATTTPDKSESPTPVAPGQFKEAPSLKDLADKGQLPPVEQRLPKDPMIVTPLDGVGKYGGTFVTSANSPGDWGDYGHQITPYILFVDKNASQVVPAIAKGYELNDDATKLTLYFREGMKWSDGQPFTVNDILFWWNDVILNDELTPNKPSTWTPGGELAKFNKVNDYTLELTFAKPYRTVLNVLSYWMGMQSQFFLPEHYLKQYHIKYNADANKLAKDQGFDSWLQLFNSHTWPGPGNEDVNMPALSPWILKSASTTERNYVRNPYYWAVDSEGNQLPYVDNMQIKVIQDKQVALLSAMQGEITYAKVSVNDLAVVKQNEDKGNYNTYLWKGEIASNPVYAFNQNDPDPVLRNIFQDVRFRQAMSVAINRDEINDLVYNGLGTPGQVTVDPNASYFEEKWATNYAQYDPDLANKLLDEMGLKKGSDGYRLRPDNKTLEIIVPNNSGKSDELVVDYWKKVGVKASLTTLAMELYYQRSQAGQLNVGVWGADRMEEIRNYIPDSTKFSMKSELGWAVQWQKWYDTKGAEGEEPPQDIKDYFNNLDQWYVAKSDAEYQEFAKKIWGFHSDKLYLIGTVGYSPSPVVVSKDLKNIPKDMMMGDSTSWWMLAQPEQWYFAK